MPSSTRSTSELRELGVGINLLPHAVRELSALGVQPRAPRQRQ